MNMFGVMEGMLGGIAADKVGDQIDKANGKPQAEDHIECLHNDLHHMKQSLYNIAKYYDDNQKHPTIDKLLSIPLTPSFASLSRLGRKHSYIFMGTSVVLTFSIPGVGQVQATPVVGWTQLDLPDGTQVTAAQTTSVIYRCTNEAMGVNAL